MIRLFVKFLLVFVCFAGCEESAVEPDNNTVAPSPPTSPQPRTYQLVWEDQFSGPSIDTSKWSFMIGSGTDYDLPSGWGNNELQYYTNRAENAFIDDSVLVIEARKEAFEGFQYTSARLRTYKKADFTFGKMEIRAKLPKGQGIWPAIWMLPTNLSFGEWPQSGEIDIMELVGHEPNVVHSTLHFGPLWPDNQSKGQKFTLNDSEFADDYHIFGLEWDVNSMKFSVDGQVFFTVNESVTNPHPYPFNNKFHFLLNIAVGGTWPGIPDDTTVFPQRMYIDYIKVYQLQ